MQTLPRRLALMAACAVTTLLGRAAGAASYDVVYLNPAGFDESFGYAAAPGQQVGYEIGVSTNSLPQAVVWTGLPGNVLNIHPAGFDDSIVRASDGVSLAGYGTNSTAPQDHALVWIGSAFSATDLNPPGMSASFAYGVSGNQEVGNAWGPSTNNNAHAMLWTGTSPNAIDLQSSSSIYDYSSAEAVAGGQQVGFGDVAVTPGTYHALLWTGSAASVVDLNPSSAGFTYSIAYGTSGTKQVGLGMFSATDTTSHALLWSGTAASAVDLNPGGFESSVAEAISGNEEVGWGFPTNATNSAALLWTGANANALNLQQFLGPNYTSSQAWAIAADGTIVGEAYNAALDQIEAVMWVPTAVPEPGSLGLLVVGVAAALVRRQRTANARPSMAPALAHWGVGRSRRY